MFPGAVSFCLTSEAFNMEIMAWASGPGTALGARTWVLFLSLLLTCCVTLGKS